MASTTPNIGLTLPTGTEGWKRSVINGNFTILDTKMGAVGNTPLQTQINTLNSQIDALTTNGGITEVKAISTSGQNETYVVQTAGLYAVKGSTGNTAGDLAVYMFTSNNAQITNMSVKNMGTYGQVFTPPIPLRAGTTIKGQFVGPSGSSGSIIKYG